MEAGHHHHQSSAVMKNTRCWSVVVRSSVPDGVTFTYPQHLVPDEGDFDIPSNSTDAELPFFVLHDRRCYAYQLFPGVIVWSVAVKSPRRRLSGRGGGVTIVTPVPAKPLLVFNTALTYLGHCF